DPLRHVLPDGLLQDRPVRDRGGRPRRRRRAVGRAAARGLPVSWPGVITAMIFSFTLSMQDFLYSLAFISVSDNKPVPLGVATELIRGDVYFWGSLMAGALLVGVPVAIVYNLFLDKFISGITGAAIK